jgi:hypothetical protein
MHDVCHHINHQIYTRIHKMKVINILIFNPNTSTKHAKYTWRCDTKGKMNGDGETYRIPGE